jgi:hypothetical protein
MDSAKPIEPTNERSLSINIHAPCSNLFVTGDHAEVTIHMANRGAVEVATCAGEPTAPENSRAMHLEPERTV